MKRLLLFALIPLFSLSAFSQEKAKVSLLKNEIRFGFMGMIEDGPIEISYERLVSHNHALGVTSTIGGDWDRDYNFKIHPYYRLYHKKNNSGFLIELHGAMTSFKRFTYSSEYDYPRKIQLGYGAAAGYKLYGRKSQIFIEVVLGGGKFISPKDAYYRFGLTAGMKFNFKKHSLKAKTELNKSSKNKTRLEPNKEANLEVKVNFLSTIFQMPEITFENYLNKKYAWGITLIYMSDDRFSLMEDFNDGSWVVSPYFRKYFGKNKCSGFFLEANMAFIFDRDKKYNSKDYYNPDRETEFYIGYGLSIGSKFIMGNKGWFGEIQMGFGKHNYDTYDGPPLYHRMGLSIGRRF